MYKKTKLKNGVRIITNSMPKMRSISLGLWVKVGGRFESQENKGSAHFIEHMLFKGSRDYSCDKIKETIEGVGGSLNAFTSEEATCFLAKIPCDYLEKALFVLSDMVINPLFPNEELEKERTVILEEIKMYKDLPQSYVYELLDELMWPNQPLGGSILGSAEIISSITRENLRDFKNQYYTPSNIVISAAGKLDHEKFAKKVGSVFKSLKIAKANIFVEAKGEQIGPNLRIFDKTTEQTHLALGFYSLKREHKLKYALSLLNIILGGNMSSRLFNEVREKRGLAYEIGSAAKRFEDTGAFIVHAGIDNKKVPQAIEVILKELEKVKSNYIKPDELLRAKEFFIGQLQLALEDTMDNMLWIGDSVLSLDKIFTQEEVIKGIKAVSKEDVLNCAKQIFRQESLKVSLIGQLKEEESNIASILKI